MTPTAIFVSLYLLVVAACIAWMLWEGRQTPPHTHDEGEYDPECPALKERVR